MSKIRVMVGDDHVFAVEGLCEIISTAEDMTIVCRVGKLFQIVPGVIDHQPDVLVLDIAWPGDKQAGIKLIPQIQDANSDTKIVAISVYPENLEPARLAGAYPLGKSFTIAELLETIRWANNDRPGVDERERILFEPLTDRETEVLNLMSMGETDKGIAAALSIADGTVKKHVGRINLKLNAKNRTEAVAIALRNNLL